MAACNDMLASIKVTSLHIMCILCPVVSNKIVVHQQNRIISVAPQWKSFETKSKKLEHPRFFSAHRLPELPRKELICVHLDSAVGLQSSCPAFDTTDNDILLTRLSFWFGIHGSVLSRFKSYLLSRTFCVKCNDCFSFLHTPFYGVPQGSVLGSLLFVMYTTPLSIILSFHICYAPLC